MSTAGKGTAKLVTVVAPESLLEQVTDICKWDWLAKLGLPG